jgi:hypothetical protein
LLGTFQNPSHQGDNAAKFSANASVSKAGESHLTNDSKGIPNLVTQPVSYDPFACTSNDNKKTLSLMA